FRIPPPHNSTLFPYTTLFRSEDVYTIGVPIEFHRPPAMAAPFPSRSGYMARQIRATRTIRRPHIGSAAVWIRPWQGLWESLSNRSEEHTSELQSQSNLVCRLL